MSNSSTLLIGDRGEALSKCRALGTLTLTPGSPRSGVAAAQRIEDDAELYDKFVQCSSVLDRDAARG